MNRVVGLFLLLLMAVPTGAVWFVALHVTRHSLLPVWGVVGLWFVAGCITIDFILVCRTVGED